ncbi:MAG: exodeoxyribonuclease VII small subunit [Lachnospiraceae bacterium]|nr:exodeoxyribonuclease VII small subunit [Lachnospiraceae bacterium]
MAGKSLEESFTELEEVITKLEQEPASLEESFQLYKKGMDLLKQCHKSIDRIEKKMLVLNEEGTTDEF